MATEALWQQIFKIVRTKLHPTLFSQPPKLKFDHALLALIIT
jgi:hypothetical protein